MKQKRVLKMDVNVTSIDRVICEIAKWVDDRYGRYICVSNVHMCMEVFDDEEYASVVNGSDMTVPDGKPIFWVLKASGFSESGQIRGEDLSMAVFSYAEQQGFSVGFFGATESVLNRMNRKIAEKFPYLTIGYSFAPPFKPVSSKQDAEYIKQINDSGVKVLFVGLGCPKQEVWMREHKESLRCTMIGVGAAFDFIAGNKKHAPRWMQQIGLEWFYRLVSEPRRLWKRYLKQNPRFVFYLILQFFLKKKY